MVEEITVEEAVIKEVETDSRKDKEIDQPKEINQEILTSRSKVPDLREDHSRQDLNRQGRVRLQKMCKVSRREMPDLTSQGHKDLSNKDRHSSDRHKTGHRSNQEILRQRNRINKKSLSFERLFYAGTSKAKL